MFTLFVYFLRSTDVEDYRREGTTSLFTYNSVKFAIINLHYAEIEDIRLQVSFVICIVLSLLEKVA